MNILIAPDKFKGSLSAQAVCTALQKGLQSARSDIEITTKPLADGGDGSLAVLDHYLNLKTIERSVYDPLMRSITAHYKFDLKTKTAYIEMSAASGLVLLKEEERNPLKTTTYGTGELIQDAIEQGAETIYLFIGGSATNDGGIGIANALGYEFYDKNDKLIPPTAEFLNRLSYIENDNVINIEQIDIKVICDVNNPFFGENGAAYVYARQKGAHSDIMILFLDHVLKHLAKVLVQQGYPEISNIPGAGAAGGVGGGMMAFFDATLLSGIQMFIELTKLEKAIANCDLIITGEGKLDAQTAQGKVISGVCALAKKYDKPVIAVCGAADLIAVKEMNLEQVYTVLERSNSVEDAMENAADKLVLIGKTIAQRVTSN
ncbi:MAG: glycerate kinase [Saprospiraceae bacterium]